MFVPATLPHDVTEDLGIQPAIPRTDAYSRTLSSEAALLPFKARGSTPILDEAAPALDLQPPHALLLDLLERVGVGAVLLDEAGRAIALNSFARTILRSEINMRPMEREEDWATRSLNTLISRARGRTKSHSDECFTISREDKRDLVLQSMKHESNHRLLVMLDLDDAPCPKPEVLQRLFSLTAAEARLAIQIARGACPADIARNNRVSIATVRTQLASVFAKTATGRQLELASLLCRLAPLS